MFSQSTSLSSKWQHTAHSMLVSTVYLVLTTEPETPSKQHNNHPGLHKCAKEYNHPGCCLCIPKRTHHYTCAVNCKQLVQKSDDVWCKFVFTRHTYTKKLRHYIKKCTEFLTNVDCKVFITGTVPRMSIADNDMYAGRKDYLSHSWRCSWVSTSDCEAACACRAVVHQQMLSAWQTAECCPTAWPSDSEYDHTLSPHWDRDEQPRVCLATCRNS